MITIKHNYPYFVLHKAIQFITFDNLRDPVSPFYKAMKCIKLSDNIRINNFQFVFDHFSVIQLALQNPFQFSASSYRYLTHSSKHISGLP